MSSVSGASGTTLDRFFSVQCCHRTIKTLGLLGLVTNTGFFFVQCCLEPKVASRVLRQPWLGFFLCIVVWSLQDNIAWSFYLCNVVPVVLRPDYISFFLVQCCLEPLGQHCAGFLSVLQYCRNSISWNKIAKDYTFFIRKPFFAWASICLT